MTISAAQYDLIAIVVQGSLGEAEWQGFASAGALQELCAGALSAVRAGELCLARTREGAIEMRIINGRLSTVIPAEALGGAVSEVHLGRTSIVLDSVISSIA
ncbi:hypothetical protein [Fimbriimonas ginsengisoli]|uniref:hypothetical protein n=1 Tax=Fimbriimonas ginsengisoli TaxID=1005039 RepID=UPI00046D1699|nr:hypothetical protein [Fimbriimonas ginsengisoli]